MKKALTILLAVILVSSITFIILTSSDNHSKNSDIINPFVSFPVSYSQAKIEAVKELENIPKDNNVKLIMFGDMMFETPLYDIIDKQGGNPFSSVFEEFSRYDLRIGNLETTIDGKANGKAQIKNYVMSAPLKAVNKMNEAHIDIVSLANNHSMDYGGGALLNSINKLNTSGIKTFGAGKNQNDAFEPLIVKVKDTRIAFIGVNNIETNIARVGVSTPGSAYFNESLLKQSIIKARSLADIVIVWPHWGEEHILKANSFQNSWGRKFIDWGADLVVGAHPHVRQNVEEYKGKKIYYSLGNFVFTGMAYDPEAIIGSMLAVTIKDNKIVQNELKNIKLTYHGYPIPF